VLIDEDGIVLRVNQAFLNLFGYRHSEAFLRKLDDLVSTSDKIKKLAARINVTTLAGMTPLTRTTIRERKDGTRIDVLFTIIPFKADGKDFAYCIYHDITERVQSRKNLRLIKKQLEMTLDRTLKAFSKVIEERDPYTAEHQRRVAYIASMLASEMNLSQEMTKTLYMAALLHDMGKIAIPAQILSKPGTLSEEEKNIVKKHSEKGFEIVRTMEFQGSVAECVLQHHERLDGSGYPHGLRGNEILFPAQILAVTDVFEAMISHRSYRPSMGSEAALEELKSGRDVKYNSQAVDALEQLVLSGELDKAIDGSNSDFS
ncbi:HD domain-containing phosphohydrolase, partial [Candidatus Oleimmundimicrobium sp.]|uniref:HD-GYP domain-containing protein n=1 Tax=Candidatus Oleimmundimicrobium sp. TaxID=3060597 RepID=UPI00271DC1A6